jgi:transcriptional regulator with XRE-family HTH domain
MSGRFVDPRFAERMRAILAERGLSYRALAERTFYGKSYLHRIAVGQTAPTAEVAARIDDALGADGELAGYVAPDVSTGAARDSAALVELLCGGHVDDAVHAAELAAQRLGIEYLTSPPLDVLTEAVTLRRTALTALPRAGDDRADLVVALGHLSGVLAYAALDLGDPASAGTHAEAVWRCGETTGHLGLRAWARGTQSLISRFSGDYQIALALAEDGTRYADDGAALTRLLCGQAQSHANLGDGPAARRALRAAADAHGREDDGDRGLFGFTSAKLAYYSGSTLIWLDKPADAAMAETESIRAIEAWAATPERFRPAGDQSLAHVYLATARLQRHQIEGAAEALAPILDLPDDRKLSWIAKRLDRIAGILAGPPFTRDPAALELCERIREF